MTTQELEQRTEALERARRMQTAVSAVLEEVRSLGTPQAHAVVIDVLVTQRGELCGGLHVEMLLRSLPGVGKGRALAMMATADIHRRRLDELTPLRAQRLAEIVARHGRIEVAA